MAGPLHWQKLDTSGSGTVRWGKPLAGPTIPGKPAAYPTELYHYHTAPVSETRVVDRQQQQPTGSPFRFMLIVAACATLTVLGIIGFSLKPHFRTLDDRLHNAVVNPQYAPTPPVIP